MDLHLIAVARDEMSHCRAPPRPADRKSRSGKMDSHVARDRSTRRRRAKYRRGAMPRSTRKPRRGSTCAATTVVGHPRHRRHCSAERSLAIAHAGSRAKPAIAVGNSRPPSRGPAAASVVAGARRTAHPGAVRAFVFRAVAWRHRAVAAPPRRLARGGSPCRATRRRSEDCGAAAQGKRPRLVSGGTGRRRFRRRRCLVGRASRSTAKRFPHRLHAVAMATLFGTSATSSKFMQRWTSATLVFTACTRLPGHGRPLADPGICRPGRSRVGPDRAPPPAQP